MKRLITALLLSSLVFSQSIRLSDIDSITNQQLDKIKSELQNQKTVDGDDSDIQAVAELTEVSTTQTGNTQESEYFGYNYFERDINFFDNIPAPLDFKLGPGDEVIISLWGETNLRKTFRINKDGSIFYENVGFINLSNKTLQEAEKTIFQELSKIYSTLNSSENSTKLLLELGAVKSINVYFSGETKAPGIHLIHPFSDIFTALIQAGITDNGSLRNIKLTRQGQLINEFDFYSFFINGDDTFSDIRVLDGDIIHIPVVSKRVKIGGEIIRDGYFELSNDETLSDLITYAGGFTHRASSNVILDSVLPTLVRDSDDNALKSKSISIKDFSNTNLNNGDSINVPSISSVETKAEIFGRVKSPGQYPASSSLKDVLDLAGGFDDPLYRKTILDNEIVIVRKDENQFYGLEFKIPYTESAQFRLVPGDKIFVYENSLYENLFSVTINGEVNKRGSFQLKKGMTIGDAINLAGGFTELANQDAITVTEVFTSTNDLGNQVEETSQVNDANIDFELTDGSIVNILPLENVVRVEGNVYNPGLVTYSKGKTVNKYINLAGGPKPNTLSTRIYVKRANGRIKKVTLFQGIGTIVRPGDTIFVPEDLNPKDFNLTSFIADLATTLANIAAILVIIDNQND
mgnify:FL=1